MEVQCAFCTRFDIYGKLDPDEMAEKLGVNAYDYWDLGAFLSDDDGNCDGVKLSVCKCDGRGVPAEELMKRTVAPLLGKVDVLNKLGEELGLKYRLQIVAEFPKGEELPPVTPPEEVVAFCRAIGAGIAIEAGKVY